MNVVDRVLVDAKLFQRWSPWFDVVAIVCSLKKKKKKMSHNILEIYVLIPDETSEISAQSFIVSAGQIKNGIRQVKHSSGSFLRSLMLLPTYSEHQSVAMGYCTPLGLKPTCRC